MLLVFWYPITDMLRYLITLLLLSKSSHLVMFLGLRSHQRTRDTKETQVRLRVGGMSVLINVCCLFNLMCTCKTQEGCEQSKISKQTNKQNKTKQLQTL